MLSKEGLWWDVSAAWPQGGTSSCCFSHHPEQKTCWEHMLGQLRSCPGSAYARSCSRWDAQGREFLSNPGRGAEVRSGWRCRGLRSRSTGRPQPPPPPSSPAFLPTRKSSSTSQNTMFLASSEAGESISFFTSLFFLGRHQSHPCNWGQDGIQRSVDPPQHFWGPCPDVGGPCPGAGPGCA